jgi:hypothetical protein
MLSHNQDVISFDISIFTETYKHLPRNDKIPLLFLKTEGLRCICQIVDRMSVRLYAAVFAFSHSYC